MGDGGGYQPACLERMVEWTRGVRRQGLAEVAWVVIFLFFGLVCGECMLCDVNDGRVICTLYCGKCVEMVGRTLTLFEFTGID